MEKLIGRESEKKILLDALQSEDSQLIAVIGRRRVGKTFLVRNVYKKQIIFEFSGEHTSNLKTQLLNFSLALKDYSKSKKTERKPENWTNAFESLKKFISGKRTQGKKVVFLDEFPWIDTPRSGFLSAFEHFWNSWASRQENLIIVICGSSASWMIKKIVYSKGGLHNRITSTIRLMPFNIKETKDFLRYKNSKLDHFQIIQLYMILGGIPFYLKSIRAGESTMQFIDRLCFTREGILTNEFENLYKSLFSEAGHHISVVRVLAKHPEGMERDVLMSATGLKSGGRFTETLTELEESGFIYSYIPFGKTTKDKITKLIDEFSFFYLKFMEHKSITGKDTWIRLSSGNSWKIWSGFAWERVCLRHTEQIKKSLGISGVHSEQGIWRNLGGKNKTGSQIDLYIDRKDNCINLCELKFYDSVYTITKDYAEALGRKLILFREYTKTNKTLFLTFISARGIKSNKYSIALIQNSLTMDFLFL